MSRTLVRLFAFVAIVLGTTAYGANVVYAHNTQETSSPANGEVLAVAPTEWIVGFTKTVPLDTASAEIVGSDGVRVALAPPRHGVTDNIIVFDLPPNLVGSVTARWRLVGVDGHVISGRIPFSVEAGAAVVPEAVVTPDSVVVPEAVVEPVAAVVEESDSTVAEPIRFSLRLVNYVSLMALAQAIISGQELEIETLRSL
jgi:methionine-rich copper-binding protein CopC